MIASYSKQKNCSSHGRKADPTLKIKNITFKRQNTKNLGLEIPNLQLKVGKNIIHKQFDCQQKNKQIPSHENNHLFEFRNPITHIFSIRSMNLCNSAKILQPIKTNADCSNSRSNLNPVIQIRNNRSYFINRNSQNVDRSSKSKSSAIVEQSKRLLSTSSVSHKSRKKTQKPIYIIPSGQKRLIINTNDKVFETKLASYYEFLKSTANLHQIQIQFVDYEKPKTVRVGKGNNSRLVKDVLKKRWWLKVQDKKSNESYSFKDANFIWTQIKVNDYYKTQKPYDLSFHNHFQFNGNLGNKKQLFVNLKHYYQSQNKNPFQFMPLTFHIKSTQDPQFQQFKASFQIQKENNLKKRQLWIVKPGQNSNRGCGITIHSDLIEIQKLIKEQKCQQEKQQKPQTHTYIIQKYIQKPFLYQRRKFDLRCYYLLVCLNNKIKAYWYSEGYIRTSCFEFNCNEQSEENLYVHLTNDAVQKNHENYGKFEDGNKIDFSTFKKYLSVKYPNKKLDFDSQVYEKIKSMALDSIKATFKMLRRSDKPVFEIFGLDFMIDEDFKPWLIEVNTNPCLETTCLVLEKIIPKMLDSAFQLSVDLIFPPPLTWASSRKHLVPNHVQSNFELIFDEKLEQAD